MVILLQPCLPTLKNERRRPDTATADVGERAQVIANHGDGTTPTFSVWPGNRKNFGLAHEADELEEFFERFVRKETDNNTPRNGDESKSERNSPFPSADRSNLEGRAANKYNDDLDYNFYQGKSLTITS